jgi:hypothetical protein
MYDPIIYVEQLSRRCAMTGLHGNVDHIIYLDQLPRWFAMVYVAMWNPDIRIWFKLQKWQCGTYTWPSGPARSMIKLTRHER